MNEQLREQLKHTESRMRHEAIVQLARMKDEDALPLLNDISKNDPEVSLRQLAERAIIHILNEYSSTMSRAKFQETAPSNIPPFSNSEAEQLIQKAYEAYESGSTANALQYLIKALDLSPLLVDDFDVQLLAENLTGMEGAEAANLLADREKRKRFFNDDTPPSSSSNFPKSPAGWAIFVLVMVVLNQFFLDDGVEIINRAFDEFEAQQFKQAVQQVNGINYYVIPPVTGATAEGYPLLVALPDGKETTTKMLHHFAELANAYGTILVIPEFPDMRFSEIAQHTETLHTILDNVAYQYPLDNAGVVLFGFSDSAKIATAYANFYPAYTASVITSGGTFLYPPPDGIPYTVMYGGDDELLRGIDENDMTFANLADWHIPLNYLTIENVGHEINSQQIDITKQVLLDVYQ